MSNNERGALARLINIMARLRDPRHGCPWDLQQTFRTIVPHTLEEVYEVVDAIEREDWDELRQELGDLLFQIVFYARLGEERQLFDFDAIAATISDKLERRHPHVFADAQIDSPQALAQIWDAVKAGERAAKSALPDASALAGIAQALPALRGAEKRQKRAATAGFDWSDPEDVIAKVREEIDEVKAAIDAADHDEVEAELGDLLFACVNLCRHHNVCAETALRGANRKFDQRFRAMEALAQQAGKAFQAMSIDEKEQLWQDVKANEVKRSPG